MHVDGKIVAEPEHGIEDVVSHVVPVDHHQEVVAGGSGHRPCRQLFAVAENLLDDDVGRSVIAEEIRPGRARAAAQA